MSPKKKTKKKSRITEESSSRDDDWLKNSPSRPNYFDTIGDSDEEVRTVNESPNHSQIVQFVKEKFPKKGMCLLLPNICCTIDNTFESPTNFFKFFSGIFHYLKELLPCLF